MIFLDTLTAPDHSHYLSAIREGSKQEVYLIALIPVLCVSGPLHKVEMSDNIEIENFSKSAKFVATRTYLEQWPGDLAQRAILAGAGYPVLLASISDLMAVLDYAYGMIRASAHVITEQGRNNAFNQLPLQVATVDEILGFISSVTQDPV